MYERGVRRTRADTVSIGLVCTSSLCLHILILFSNGTFTAAVRIATIILTAIFPSHGTNTVCGRAGGLASRTR